MAARACYSKSLPREEKGMKIEPQLLNFETVGQGQFEAINTFINQMRKESMPDDPPRSLENTRTNLKNLSGFENYAFNYFYVLHEKRVIAVLFTEVQFADTNQHLMQINIGVLPQFRRQGIASRLLKLALDVADEHKRTLIVNDAQDRIPAGGAFAEALGSTAGLKMHTNQLRLAELDDMLINQWIADAKVTATEFELCFLDGPLPEEDIDELVAMMHVMDSAPTDNLEVEDEKVTPERIREWEASMQRRGVTRWFYYLKYKPTGELAGYTELGTDPDNSNLLFQGDTGVLPKFRGNGLGKWLKAAMLEKIIREKPEVKFIRTGNADSNASMLAINHKLGFKSYIARTVWQLDVERLRAYLSKKGII